MITAYGWLPRDVCVTVDHKCEPSRYSTVEWEVVTWVDLCTPVHTGAGRDPSEDFGFSRTRVQGRVGDDQ